MASEAHLVCVVFSFSFIDRSIGKNCYILDFIGRRIYFAILARERVARIYDHFVVSRRLGVITFDISQAWEGQISIDDILLLDSCLDLETVLTSVSSNYSICLVNPIISSRLSDSRED